MKAGAKTKIMTENKTKTGTEHDSKPGENVHAAHKAQNTP